MIFTTTEVASIVGGTVSGPDVDVDGASIDSRSVEPGALFVPIVAERDGHDFIEAALDAGAAAYLTSGTTPRGTAVIVDDTARALTELGSAGRDRLTGPVVGVTGSVGKTSVKDLLVAGVGTVRRAHANPASFNNELGLPLTLVNAPSSTEIAVLEMGARGLGHIAELCRTGRPTIGVVTCVAGAHTELFGSLDGVAEGKRELVEALPADGVAVLNADDHRVLAMGDRTRAEIITFGRDADVRVDDLRLDGAMRPRFVLVTPWGSAEVRLGLAGAHMAQNAAAAIAAGGAAGVALDDLVRGVEGASASRWRMEVLPTATGAIVVNDAYNANPTSVRAALATLRQAEQTTRTAVLGVMAELGSEHGAEHRAVASEALASGIRVIAVNAPDYGEGVEHVESIDEAADRIGHLGPDDIVLVKGSRVAGLERLAATLADSAGGAE